MPRTLVLPTALAALVLGGCAARNAATRPTVVAAPIRPDDCSFRSPTTCWTMSVRLTHRVRRPPPRPLPPLRRTVLATATDSGAAAGSAPPR
jgi:hypothetical protein